jgi:hypothetical protein
MGQQPEWGETALVQSETLQDALQEMVNGGLTLLKTNEVLSCRAENLPEAG